MYAIKELPTIQKIQNRLREMDSSVHISNRHLGRVLKEMKYVFRKTTDNRDIATERPEARELRAKFLRDIDRYRREQYNIVYLDETWLNKNHCRAAAWYPSFDLLKELIKQQAVDFHPIPNIPTGKGKRLIILHAGCASTGFIPHAEKVIETYRLCIGHGKRTRIYFKKISNSTLDNYIQSIPFRFSSALELMAGTTMRK